MKVIKESICFEYEIKKSRFVCQFQYVENVYEAKEFIENIKKKHSAATHNCSCYTIREAQKVDDDGEPKATAGLPMLEVLKHHNIDNICVVVTRYFGGIKLGHGGLIRAYSKSVAHAIAKSKLLCSVPGVEFKVQFLINHVATIDYVLNKLNINIIEKEFGNIVVYKIIVSKKTFKDTINQLRLKVNNIEIKDKKIVEFFEECSE